MTPGTSTGPSDTVVIVGAGLAGLAAALHLAGAGRTVTVVEQAAQVGGKAGTVRSGGYVFDSGPTVLTMPELISETFAAVGEDLADWLELIPVDPAYRAHYPDGSQLNAHADPDKLMQEIAQVCGRQEADGCRRFLSFLRRLYACEFNEFVNRDIDGLRSVITPGLVRLVAMGAFRSMEAKVGQYLRDPRAQQLFSFQALYAGVAPHRARALYTIISYMDIVSGVFFPRGGMNALPQALAGAAAKHGVIFRHSTTVERIETSLHGRARAVITTGGERIPTDTVVLAVDPSLAYPRLLGRNPVRVQRLRYSPSCVLLLAGAPRPTHERTSPPAHHNIHFGRSWRQGFDDIVRDGRLMRDPSFLVSIPTVSDPCLAPSGRHSYYVLFPTPNLHTAPLDWEKVGPRYQDEMLSTLARNGYSTLADSAENMHLITPADWARQGCPAGTPFSAAHTFWQTGPLRTRKLAAENIVFAGAGTHPGVGVPTVLISGRLAAERVTGAVRNIHRLRGEKR
jgi:phytoene desaturase